jgi:adenylate cyclase
MLAGRRVISLETPEDEGRRYSQTSLRSFEENTSTATEEKAIVSAHCSSRIWILCSIRFLIPFFNFLVVLVTGIVVWAICYFLSQASINDVGGKLQFSISERIHETVLNLLSYPPQVLDVMTDDYKLGLYNFSSTTSMLNSTWRFVHLFPQVSSVYFGTKDKQFVRHERMGNNSFNIWYSYPPGDTNQYTFMADSNTGLQIPGWAPSAVKTNYNVLTRPWYAGVVTTKRQTWTGITSYTSGGLRLTVAKPFLSSSNAVNAVIGVDFTILNLNGFLQSLKVADTGVSFIVDTTGLLVATSAGNVNADTTGSQIAAVNSSDPTVSSISNAIVNTYGGFSNIPLSDTNTSTITFSLNGQKYFIEFSTIIIGADINWVVCVVIPYNDIMGKVDQGNIIIFTTTAAVIVISVAVAIIISLCITFPLGRLSTQMESVSKMSLDHFEGSKSLLYEVRKIQISFFSMVYALKSFAKYVPVAVIRQTMLTNRVAQLDLSTKKAVFFFLDIVDFTALSEQLEPKTLLMIMSEAMEELTKIIQKEEGFVDKFIGNHIIAISDFFR